MKIRTGSQYKAAEGRVVDTYWDMNGKLLVGFIIVFALLLGALFPGCKAYNRYQTRADANNRVKVTQINIRTAQQQARVVNAQTQAVIAKANQRYQAAVGVRRAQDEIAKTLTPLYVQFEAIEAQKAIAVGQDDGGSK
jgi:cell division protein YceG involved in septum cleavage